MHALICGSCVRTRCLWIGTNMLACNFRLFEEMEQLFLEHIWKLGASVCTFCGLVYLCVWHLWQGDETKITRVECQQTEPIFCFIWKMHSAEFSYRTHTHTNIKYDFVILHSVLAFFCGLSINSTELIGRHGFGFNCILSSNRMQNPYIRLQFAIWPKK